MWNPPIVLTSEEQKIAARTRKTRKFFVFLREHRHELLDADLQHTLANSYSPEPGGHEPVEAGLLALATLLQAYCHVGDRDAVELTVMDKRWQMVLDCLGAEHPPSVRAPCLTSGCDSSPTTWTRPCWIGPSHWRSTPEASVPGNCAVLDSTPLFGAGRVEDTLNLLGHALRKAVGLAAQALDTSAEVLVEDAGLTLVGHSSLKAHWTWIGGAHAPRAGLGPGGGGTVATLAGAAAHPGGSDTSSAGGHGDHHAAYHAGHRARPGGGPGGRRIKQHVAPDRRISIEDQDMRHGRKSSAKTFNGFKEHFAVDG